MLCCVVLCCLHDMISVAPPTSAVFGASEINMSSLIWSTYCLRSWKCRFLSLVSELVFWGTPLYFRRWLAFGEKSGVEKMTTTEEWKWRQQKNENGDNTIKSCNYFKENTRDCWNTKLLNFFEHESWMQINKEKDSPEKFGTLSLPVSKSLYTQKKHIVKTIPKPTQRQMRTNHCLHPSSSALRLIDSELVECSRFQPIPTWYSTWKCNWFESEF